MLYFLYYLMVGLLLEGNDSSSDKFWDYVD
jgi:hypothetical protein